jgi:hypothetical protein
MRARECSAGDDAEQEVVKAPDASSAHTRIASVPRPGSCLRLLPCSPNKESSDSMVNYEAKRRSVSRTVALPHTDCPARLVG